MSCCSLPTWNRFCTINTAERFKIWLPLWITFFCECHSCTTAEFRDDIISLAAVRLALRGMVTFNKHLNLWPTIENACSINTIMYSEFKTRLVIVCVSTAPIVPGICKPESYWITLGKRMLLKSQQPFVGREHWVTNKKEYRLQGRLRAVGIQKLS